MCLQRVNATLAGRAPHHVNTSFISRMLNGRTWTGLDLDRVASEARWYQGLDKPITDDGYVWFWGLNFRSPGGIIRILIPHANDRQRTDGIALDRQVTVYADEGVGESQVYAVVFDFINALQKETAARIRRSATTEA